MNIQKSVEQGIIRAAGKISLMVMAGGLIALTAPKAISAGEKAYNNVKDRIETEKAIKAEGIQAQSYAEAKMQLDSIRFDRLCNEVGMPVPKKPSEGASLQERIDYLTKKNEVYMEANRKSFNEIIQNLESIKE